MWMSVWAVSLLVSMGAPVSTSKGATPVSVPLAGLERTVKRVSEAFMHVSLLFCYRILLQANFIPEALSDKQFFLSRKRLPGIRILCKKYSWSNIIKYVYKIHYFL